ncbi:MAG: hypothetical protein K9H16_09325 [Bacteroidales bacterium]|nr:hypothetical protein [Bacteroidales bacterium]
MIDQTKNLDEKNSGGWTEKKEAMQRLAKALENTAPPLMNKNSVNTHLTEQPSGSVLLRKVKTFLTRIFKNL